MPKTVTESFSHKLFTIRKARGLSQYDLSELTGISHRMIVHYEKHAKNPPSKAILQLAKALKVSVDELIGNKPTKEKELVKNRNLLKKIIILDNLPPEDQKTISKHIDDLNAKYTTARSK